MSHFMGLFSVVSYFFVSYYTLLQQIIDLHSLFVNNIDINQSYKVNNEHCYVLIRMNVESTKYKDLIYDQMLQSN